MTRSDSPGRARGSAVGLDRPNSYRPARCQPSPASSLSAQPLPCRSSCPLVFPTARGLRVLEPNPLHKCETLIPQYQARTACGGGRPGYSAVGPGSPSHTRQFDPSPRPTLRTRRGEKFDCFYRQSQERSRLWANRSGRRGQAPAWSRPRVGERGMSSVLPWASASVRCPRRCEQQLLERQRLEQQQQQRRRRRRRSCGNRSGNHTHCRRPFVFCPLTVPSETAFPEESGRPRSEHPLLPCGRRPTRRHDAAAKLGDTAGPAPAAARRCQCGPKAGAAPRHPVPAPPGRRRRRRRRRPAGHGPRGRRATPPVVGRGRPAGGAPRGWPVQLALGDLAGAGEGEHAAAARGVASCSPAGARSQGQSRGDRRVRQQRGQRAGGRRRKVSVLRGRGGPDPLRAGARGGWRVGGEDGMGAQVRGRERKPCQAACIVCATWLGPARPPARAPPPGSHLPPHPSGTGPPPGTRMPDTRSLPDPGGPGNARAACLAHRPAAAAPGPWCAMTHAHAHLLPVTFRTRAFCRARTLPGPSFSSACLPSSLPLSPWTPDVAQGD
jgi:hypothetical protein